MVSICVLCLCAKNNYGVWVHVAGYLFVLLYLFFGDLGLYLWVLACLVNKHVVKELEQYISDHLVLSNLSNSIL